MKNFSGAWMTWSTNLKVSNVLEHDSSEVHKVAMTQLQPTLLEHEENRKLQLDAPCLQWMKVHKGRWDESLT